MPPAVASFEENCRHRHWVRRAARITALISAAILALLSLGTIAGWVLHIKWMASLTVGIPVMKFNSAVGYLLASIALACGTLERFHKKQTRWLRIAGLVATWGCILIGCLTLSSCVVDPDSKWDQIAMIDPFTPHELHPGRTSGIVACSLVLAGLALLIFRRARLFALFQICTGGIAALGWFGVATFLFGVRQEDVSWHFTATSVPATLCMLSLAIGLAALRPFEGLTFLLASGQRTGLIFQRLLVAATLVPFVIGMLWLVDARRHEHSLETLAALFSTAIAVTLVAVIMRTGRMMEQLDQKRRQGARRVSESLAETKAALTRATAYLEAAPGGMLVMDLDGKILRVNAEAERLFGYSGDQLRGCSLELLIPEILKDRSVADLVKISHFGTDSGLNGQRRDGQQFPLALSLRDLETAEGAFVIGSIRDVSAERQAARMIEERERRLREAYRIARLGIWEWDAATGQLQWSEELFRIFDIDPASVTPSRELSLAMIHPADRAEVFRRILKATRDHREHEHEFRIVTGANQVRYVSGKTTARWDAQGKLRGLHGTALDITREKSAEQALTEAEERWNFALEGSENGVWDWNIVEGTNFYSDRWKRMLGYEPHEIGQDTREWNERIHEEDRRAALGALDRHLAGQSPIYVSEHRLRCKDGSHKWVLDRGKVTHWSADRKPLRMVGTQTDITVLKQTQTELQEASERLHVATGAAGIGIWDWDLATGALVADDQNQRLYGVQPGEFKSHVSDWIWRVHPDDAPRVQQELELALKGERDYESVYRIIWPDGSSHHIRAYGAVKRDASGRPVRVIGTNWDVTKQRGAEEELWKSRQMLQTIVDHLPQRVFWKSPSLVYLGCNLPAAHDAGLKRTDDIVGKTDFDLDWKASAHLYREDDSNVVKTGVARTLYAEPQLRKDGSMMWLRTSKIPLRDSEGKIFGVLGTYEDITEIKRAEAALQASEERFRHALEYSAIGIALLRINGTWMVVNRALCDIVGYSEAELLQMSFRDITHPDDLEADGHFIRELLSGKITNYHFEKRYIHKTGRIVWIHLSVSLVHYGDGSPANMVAQIQDITLRREAEEKLKESLGEKVILLKEIHHRVKNNMQVISSILQLQAGYMHDPADVEIFKECQLRIQTMAMVHERLYQSGDFGRVDFGPHLRELVQLHVRGQTKPGRVIELDLHTGSVLVPLDTAIPLGLIASELITNCYKHAFADRTKGTLHVSLRQTSSDLLEMIVADDGVGLPANFDLATGRSLGLRLIRSLARQLRAEVSISSQNGTRVCCVVPFHLVS